MRTLIALSIAMAPMACLRSTQYQCASNEQCGTGRCEPNGLCSAFDPECAGSMHRYTEGAGSLSNTCVDGSGGVDAGIDAADSDALADAPASNCPGDFTSIPGGTTGHRYKLISNTEEWDTHRTGCAGMGTAYLGIPDDATELEAMVELSDEDEIWLGITDAPPSTEGTFVNVKGAAQMFLPWESGAPSTTPPQNDCVRTESDDEITDEDCEDEYPAVCECED